MATMDVKEIDQTIQHHVQLQLTEKGEYCPIELLITMGRLLYVDYQEWRRGRVASLDQVLVGVANVKALLEQAQWFAVKTGLTKEPMEWQPWVDRSTPFLNQQNELVNPAADAPEQSGDAADANVALQNAGNRLKISDQTDLHDLLACSFQPPRHHLQLDLFYDNASTSIENQVINAFVEHSVEQVTSALDDLYQQDPSHADLGVYEHLKRYLQHCDQRPCTEKIVEREFLVLSEKIVPMAHSALKSRARDFLVPCWLRLIAVVVDMPIDERPESVSLSRLYWEVGSWQSVIDASENELTAALSIDLLVRRALAFDRLHQSARSYQVWFQLAILYPEVFRELIEEQPDAQLQQLWSRFEELLEGASSITSLSVSVADYPAFVLLTGSGIWREFLAMAMDRELENKKQANSDRGEEVEISDLELIQLNIEWIEQLQSCDLSTLEVTISESSIRKACELYQTLLMLLSVDGVANFEITPEHAEQSIRLRKQLSELSPALMEYYLQIQGQG